jgi:hypothetical protein
MDIKNIAKLSSYGAYIDEEFIYTNSLVEGKNVIVGNIAEYMYDLEQELAKKGSDTARDVIGDLAELIINHSGRLTLEDLYEIAEKYGVKVG